MGACSRLKDLLRPYVHRYYEGIVRRAEKKSQRERFRSFSNLGNNSLERFKGIHQGERCFLIGNAPSIKELDLKKLANEKTFVSNMFLYHPDTKTIAPDYYCVVDAGSHWPDDILVDSLAKAVHEFPETEFFYEFDALRAMRAAGFADQKNINYLFMDPTRTVYDHGLFEADITKRLSLGYTVVVDFMFPLALYMGFTEIYLLGVDMNYGIDKDEIMSSKSYFYDLKKDERQALFNRGYFAIETGRERYETVQRSFDALLKKTADENVKVYNTSSVSLLQGMSYVEFNEAVDRNIKGR